MDSSSAVVIGAGMAGLAAARVLSRRYDTVTVLDRDELPAEPVPRRGVPQGQHGPILLISGLRELAGLFPGLEDELVARGGIRFDQGAGLVTYRYGRRGLGVPTGLELISMSRPMLEGTIRDRVAAEPNVTIRDRVAVSALTGDTGRVTGVVLGDGSTLDADLVVDCTGRGSRSDRWPGDLGFPSPEQVEIRISVAYTTRIYRRSPGELEGKFGALVLPDPPGERRAGLVLPIEGDRWLVAVGGDFAYPQTEGPHPRTIRLTNWYAKRIALAAQIDRDVNVTFLSVQQLLTPSEVLFRPGMIARVLRLSQKRLSAEVPSR